MPDFEFNEWGEAFEDGVVVALAPGHRHWAPKSDVPGNEWVIVAYGKYGADVSNVFPITALTGDKAEVQDFCDRHFAPTYGGKDRGTRSLNYGTHIKHFTRVMPAKDFLE